MTTDQLSLIATSTRNKATNAKAPPLLTDLIDCQDCEGDGECFECSGSGKCSTCGGDGEDESSRAFCNALYWEHGAIQQRCDRRAPEGSDESWHCDEHRRQQARVGAHRAAGSR